MAPADEIDAAQLMRELDEDERALLILEGYPAVVDARTRFRRNAYGLVRPVA